ncbi:hypothetical protein V502_00607 [Pseudogymnoascus sp. VKM F-4520 (FW-2644)]|nr:hypothetical protein V502_00607 [Pseudogymnoascus sp. VKM F-4520 (FW-2644)]
MNQVPIIDCTPLFTSDSLSSPEYLSTISKIHSAFRTWGIFILTGTAPIPPELTNSLCVTLDKFFLLPDHKKDLLHLKNGGLAWRGYMPWGGEGTKGSTDQKEELGLAISDAMSVGLGFEKGELRRRFLEPEPIQLFRSFKYSAREGVKSYGIGEHSDFGFLTLLSQNAPSLQVLSPSKVGDILDRLTSGLYISPLHRVLPPLPTSDRISIPFFFDPAWTAEIQPLLLSTPTISSVPDPTIIQRWQERSTFFGESASDISCGIEAAVAAPVTAMAGNTAHITRRRTPTRGAGADHLADQDSLASSLACYTTYRQPPTIYIVTNILLYDPVHGVVICRVCTSCVVLGRSGKSGTFEQIHTDFWAMCSRQQSNYLSNHEPKTIEKLKNQAHMLVLSFSLRAWLGTMASPVSMHDAPNARGMCPKMKEHVSSSHRIKAAEHKGKAIVEGVYTADVFCGEGPG